MISFGKHFKKKNEPSLIFRNFMLSLQLKKGAVINVLGPALFNLAFCPESSSGQKALRIEYSLDFLLLFYQEKSR